MSAVLRIGLYDHFGWAVAVTVEPAGFEVVDRRRLELVEAGVTPAPIHYDKGSAALVASVRASIRRAAGAALDSLAASLPAAVSSLSLRAWPEDFPTAIEVLHRSPWEARADAVMYRQELAALAAARGWAVDRYDAKVVVERSRELLGARADDVLDGPRARLGPPWTKDHRTALAAAVLAGSP